MKKSRDRGVTRSVRMTEGNARGHRELGAMTRSSESAGRVGETEVQRSSPRVLAASADSDLQRILERCMQEAEVTLDTRMSGRDAVAAALFGRYDALILDLVLPDCTALETIRELRQAESALPILVLARSGRTADRVHCLESGADDCVDRQVHPSELTARVRALLRRRKIDPRRIVVADLEMDFATQMVRRSGQRIHLTATEFALLRCLAQAEGRRVTRRAILERVWGAYSDASSNVIDVYVGYLRRKIDDPFPLKLLHTCRGVGYMLAREPKR